MTEETKTENLEIQEEQSGVDDTTKNDPKPVPYSVFSKYAKAKTELTGQLAEANVQLEQYESKISEYESKINEYKGYKTQIDQFNTERLTEKNNKWKEMSKVLEAKEGDKVYEKVQKVINKFNLPTDDKPLTTEQLDKNFELMEIFNETNYFGVDETDKKNLHNEKPAKAENVGKGKYYGYETPQDLARADWKLAEKWKKEHNGHW